MTEITGTLSQFGHAATGSMRQLEFGRVMERVAARAVSRPGRERVLSRVPVTDAETVERELDAVAAVARLLRRQDDFAAQPLPEAWDLIERLDVAGSLLEGEQLSRVRAAVEAMRAVRQMLEERLEEEPILEDYLAELPPAAVSSELECALEPNGELRDGASDELGRSRRKVRETRERLVAFLRDYLRRLDRAHLPARAEVTLKGARYVIPILREGRSRIPGIVHGESGSGATLFVEPTAAVEIGNELAEWEAREKRAELAVLRRLTDLLRPWSGQLREGWEMCVSVDDLAARASYAVAVDGYRPAIDRDADLLRIRNGRHPLLLSEDLQVVPFSLELGESARALLVSGPNAGGKTVLLKGVGLLVAMTQAGVIPPVDEQTVVPLTDRIFTDIGDNQSIAESLSTFSAHLRALRAALEEADARTLVLIDEFGTGTDPDEGSALGAAMLEELIARRSLVVATTHLNPLKEFAAEREDVLNASLRFDEDTLTPTYELQVGIPGRSYGLAMAGRMGLADGLLARARELIPSSERKVDALLSDLASEKAENRSLSERLEAAERELAQRSSQIHEKESELEERASELERREAELERSGRSEARKYLLAARERVEEAIRMAREGDSRETARAARRAVEEGVADEGEKLDELAEKLRAKGWKVSGSNRSAPGGTGAATQEDPAPRPAPTPTHVAEIEARSEIDIRGRTSEEAEQELVAAIDAAVAADLPALRIIHGKGGGVLRATVQGYLRDDSRVTTYRTAPPYEGGTGVTIAELAP